MPYSKDVGCSLLAEPIGFKNSIDIGKLGNTLFYFGHDSFLSVGQLRDQNGNICSAATVNGQCAGATFINGQYYVNGVPTNCGGSQYVIPPTGYANNQYVTGCQQWSAYQCDPYYGCSGGAGGYYGYGSQCATNVNLGFSTGSFGAGLNLCF